MSLRGIKPVAEKRRLKTLFYGKAGVGKTMAAIQFPRPYLIDTEKGAVNDQYIKLLNQQNGALFATSDFDELMKEIKSLLTEKHQYQTLIIDPLTVVYDDLLDKAANRVGTEFGRHYGEANKAIKRLLNMLLRLDMNVIITSHAKNEYGDNLKVIGQTFDCYKKLDYLFDLVFRIERRGKERIAFVEKTRINEFPESEYFPFSYPEISKRYGVDTLERDSTPEFLATDADVKELKRLIDLLKIQSDETDKWLKKANAEAFEEMSKENIEKCIVFLQSKIKGEAT